MLKNRAIAAMACQRIAELFDKILGPPHRVKKCKYKQAQ
jgi:hypothetical protein